MQELEGLPLLESSTINALLKAGSGLLSVSKAAVALGVSNRAAATRLGSLVRRGWARRVRRGLYLVSPLSTEPNQPVYAEAAWVLADEIFSPCYIGGWSAAQYWGLTGQFPMSTLVVTAANLRSSSATVAGHSFRLFKVAKNRIEGAVPILRHGTTVLISSPERTLVDCLRNPELCGGIAHLVPMLRTYSSQLKADFSKLIEEAGASANGAAWKRLGFLAESEWPKMRHVQEIAKLNLSAGYSRLDPWNKERGRLVRRWRLWVNTEWRQRAETKTMLDFSIPEN